MKNKISIILIIAILIIIPVSILSIVKNVQKSKNKDIIDIATTTKEERIFWDSFLNTNPYLSQINTIPYTQDTDLIKLAITSDNVETERIVTEEITARPSLTMGDGYKKSKNNINEYLTNLLGEEVSYNFVETHVQEYDYLIIGEEYVYYTKMQLPEKIYIAVTYEEKDNNYQVQIYEYDVTEINKQALTKMLETGEINKEISISNKYILTGQIQGENIKITGKTTLNK